MWQHRSRVSPAPLLLLLLGAALLNGLVGIARITEPFRDPAEGRLDIVQDFLMARALRAGIDPYLPINELARLTWPDRSPRFLEFDHSSPHTLSAALLLAPFAARSFAWCAGLWLALELACLIASLILFLRWWPARASPGRVGVLLVAALGWMPVAEDLWVGQFGPMLLLATLLAWRALAGGRDLAGGAWLGVMFGLKLFGWFPLLYLAWRRRWRATAGAAGVIAAAHVAWGLLLGFGSVADYYLRIAPAASERFGPLIHNVSSWSWGPRIFEALWLDALLPPRWVAAAGAVFTFAFPAALLVLGLRIALGAGSFDVAFAWLCGVGLLLSPLTWNHYLLQMALPLAVVLRRALALAPEERRRSLLVVVVLLVLSSETVGLIGLGFSSGFFALAALITIFGLLALLLRLDP